MKNSATQTEPEPILNFILQFASMLSLSDWIRTVTIILLFTRAFFGSRKFYMATDFLSICLAGFSFLLFPRVVIGFQVTQELGVLHVSMIQVWGALFLGLAATTYLSRNSSDGIVKFSHYLTRISSLLIMVFMTLLHYFSNQSLFNIQNLTFNFLFFGCLFICTIRHLYKESTNVCAVRAPNVKGWLQGALLADTVHNILVSILHYSHTSSLLGSFTLRGVIIDDLHIILSHTMSGLVLGFAFQSLLALLYSDKEDKRNILKARLLTMFISQPMVFYPVLYNHCTKSFGEMAQTQMMPISIMLIYGAILIKTR